MRVWSAVCGLAVLAALLAWQADADAGKQKKKKVEITDPKEAGPDFLVQGEYFGKLGDEDAGAQVIAQGDGNFTVVLLKGGLPGKGWDEKTKIPGKGKTEGDKTILSAGGWEGEIANGSLKVRKDGQTAEGKHVVRTSPTEGAKPPEGAVVLFDGTTVDAWEKNQNDPKLVEGHLLNNGIQSKQAFKDFRLHLEFRLPYMPFSSGQGRANSGVYLQSRYELQILDSFGLKGKDNECGGFYQQSDPKVNMCFPPLSWQTYDVDFKAARFDGTGKRVAPAHAVVKHNGVLVQDYQFKGITPGGTPEADTPGKLYLQNHGNPVYFRNIWVVELK
jgi:hypothetical protein